MTAWTISIPIRRPLMLANDQRRLHWSKVRTLKAEMEKLVGWQARAQLPPPNAFDNDPVAVSIVWFAPNAIRRDPDSLAPFTKAACDVLVRCGYLIDDSAVWITRIEQRVLVDRANPRIEIRIETVTPPTPSEENQP